MTEEVIMRIILTFKLYVVWINEFIEENDCLSAKCQ